MDIISFRQDCGSALIYCGSGSGCESGSSSGPRVLITKNLKKYKAEKNLYFFQSKIAIYLSLCLYNGRPSYRRSLQLSQENIQQFKT
jgi:hypothetical protein